MLTLDQKFKLYQAIQEGKSVVSLSSEYGISDFQQFAAIANSLIPQWNSPEIQGSNNKPVRVQRGFLLGFAIEKRTYNALKQSSNTIFVILNQDIGDKIVFYSEEQLVRAILEELERQNATV